MAAASFRATQSVCASLSSTALKQLTCAKAHPSKPIAGASQIFRPVSCISSKTFFGVRDFGNNYARQGPNRGVSMQAEAGPSGSGDSGDLAKKRCVPCEGKNVKALQKDAAEELLHEVPGWDLVTEGEFKLRREWKTKNFLKGLELMGKIGEIAEAEGHHPDLHLVGWNKLSVEINTHSIRGLSENDFILAAKINEINTEEFLRKKKAS